MSYVDPSTWLCLSDPAIVLTVTSLGGSFSGAGISNGLFDPAVAGLGTHTISYNYATAECSITSTIEITVDECLSIASTSSTSTVQDFPNPANENVTIKGLNTPCDLRLFNHQGQLVWAAKSTQSSYVLPLSSFAADMYVLNIQSQ